MNNPAETYDRYMVPSLFARCAATLIERADPPLLNLVCSTSIVA